MFSYTDATNRGCEILRRKTGLRAVAFKINADKVRRAIYWLVSNNDLYKNVHIDDSVLAELREACGEVTLESIFGQGNNLSERLDPTSVRFSTCMDVNPITPEQLPGILAEQYGAEGPTVTINREGGPCNLKEVPNLLAQVFPTLFPDGKGSNYTQFLVPMTTAEMLTHTMRFGDPRFARHYRYLFMMTNIKNLDTAYRSISTVMKGRILKTTADGFVQDVTPETFDEFSKPVRVNHVFDPTIQDFKDSKQLEDLIKRKHLIFGNLRGTPPYWEGEKNRIRNMIALKGKPTAFVTLSSADSYWPDLEKYLYTYYE